MNYFRAILSGIVCWLLVIASFYLLENIEAFKDSVNKQGVVVLLLIPVYAIAGAALYYKGGTKMHGLQLGLIMTVTALMLDVLITVPLVEMPKGVGYSEFFGSAILWVLVALNMISVSLYARYRV